MEDNYHMTTEQPLHQWKLRAAHEVHCGKDLSIIKYCAISEIYSELVFINITIVY